MRKHQKGFSLIELLIVVAIILIIAAIAIPNLLSSRMAANEASAVGSLRTIDTAEMTYSTTYPDQGYTDLGSLGGVAPCLSATPAAACLIDEVLSIAKVKSGYGFTAVPAGGLPNVNYTSTALPTIIGSSGQRAFCSDQSGILRYNATGAACTNTDPAL
jgi:prepilin-type N-terminal cleavage/methylation domain-containing protein